MSILIIGVGVLGAKVAENINNKKMPGVNCAIIGMADYFPRDSSIQKRISIVDRYPCIKGYELQDFQNFAEKRIEDFKAFIIEGTSEDWEK